MRQALGRVAEESHDPLNRFFHAVEFGEGRIDADGAVHEDPAEPLVVARVDDLGLADGGEHALGRTRIAERILGAFAQILVEGEFCFLLAVVLPGKHAEEVVI